MVFGGVGVVVSLGFKEATQPPPRARDPMPGVTDLVSGALGEPHDEKIRVYLGIAQTVIGSHMFCCFSGTLWHVFFHRKLENS